MILCTHADAGFLNKTISCSCARAHIYLSENDPFPRFNSDFLSIAQIIRFVMASAAEAELAVLLCHSSQDDPAQANTHWHGMAPPKIPIQTNNSTAVGVTNKTIVPCRAKMMDLCLWWLQCRGSQEQFSYYWNVGSKNWANYHTKHHPDTYHEVHQLTLAGIWETLGA